MSVGCTRLLLATGAPPDPFTVLRGHSPPIIGGRLIPMLRVTVIFAFARSAMPVLHTLVRGASACLISPQDAMAPGRKNGSAASSFPFGATAGAAPLKNRPLVIICRLK